MARITVEDCLGKLDNRFELVIVASTRARQLATGGREAHLTWENDKPTVMALREIAAGLVDRGVLHEKRVEFDDDDMGLSLDTPDSSARLDI